jgi:hypothetical protein
VLKKDKNPLYNLAYQRLDKDISIMGSSILRKALYFPAISAKNHNLLLKLFAQKLEKKGKHTMVIIGAIMRKLLQICFGVLKYKTPFNLDVFINIS